MPLWSKNKVRTSFYFTEKTGAGIMSLDIDSKIGKMTTPDAPVL